MEKDFGNWIELKSQLHFTKAPVFFKEREIWWCSVGCNVGEEVEGKSRLFSRPVLIIKKLTRYSFLGLPTTTANKQGSWYVPISYGSVNVLVMLNQVRVFSSKRLSTKLSTLDTADFKRVKEEFLKFLQ